MDSKKNFIIFPTSLYAFLKPLFFVILGFGLIALGIIFFRFRATIIPLSIPFFLIYFYKALYIKTTKYEISAQQIKHTRGVFSIKTDYLELYRVKDFGEHRSFLMRLLAVMKVTLITSDKSDPIFEMNGIPKSNITKVLRELVETNRVKKRVFEID